MVVFSLFFGRLARIPSDSVPCPIFSYAAMLPWQYFATATANSSNSLVGSSNLLTKVYFPRLVIPLASVLPAMIDFAIAFVVLLGMMAYYGIAPTWNLIFLPLFLLLALVTALGTGLWLSAMNVQYRDIRYAVPFLVQFWMFASPVTYPSSLVPEPWRALYSINPMASVIEGFRWALLATHTATGPMTAVSVAAAVTLLLSGAYYFRRMEKTFGDVVQYMSDLAIRVQNLGKRYRIGGKQERYKRFTETVMDTLSAPIRRLRSLGKPTPPEEIIWALKDVSFEVKRGEVVGMIGRNGAGKTTLLKVLSRITEPKESRAEIRGRVGSLLEVGTGFHPELTGRDNIYLNGAILGMPRAEIDAKFDEIVAFSEMEKFLDTPVKRYSSGMYVRLAFAVAAHLEPEILLVDEVLAVGDAQFQKKCLGKMGEVAREGRTVLFVSHNMSRVQGLCSSAMLLDLGQEISSGPVDDVVSFYLRTFVGARDPGRISRRMHKNGTGELLIDSVLLEDRAGQPVLQARINEPLTVTIIFSVKQPVRDIRIGLGINTITGTRVATVHHTDQGLEPFTGDVGLYEMAFSVLSPLLPNTYVMSGSNGWFNVCSMLEIDPNQEVYPRGFPYRKRHQQAEVSTVEESGPVRLNAGLWLGHPDLDAVTWLAAPCRATSFKGESVLLGRDAWCPINTQNTSLHCDLIVAYYFVRMGYSLAGMAIDRYGDIFSGYFCQACVRHLGHRIRVGTPVAFHGRNAHSYLRDLTHELACILVLEDLTEWLCEATLQGSTYPETYLSLAVALDHQVERFRGSIWTDAARGYFHQMTYCMRQWVVACQQIG